MKKTIALSFILFATIISCTAQKNQERAVTAYQKLKLLGSVNVIYTNSDSLTLNVSAAEKDLEKVETRVENGTLVIENKGTFKTPVTVYLKNNALLNIDANGATSFKSTNDLNGDSIFISTSGAAVVNFSGSSLKLNCLQSGASTVQLKGKSGAMHLTLSGASGFKGYGLTVGNAVVNASGASSAKVFVTDKIKASASGASSIKVKGEPREVNAEATPAASISKVEGQASNKDKEDRDTTVYNWKGKKILIIKDDESVVVEPKKHHSDTDEDFKHWAGFSMGVNGYFNNSGGINVPKTYKYMDLNYSRSFNFQFNILERQFNLVKNYVKLVTGVGIDYHLYEFANKTSLNADSSFTWGKIDSTNNYSYHKNKLRATYLQVPLLVEFNTSNNPEKTVHIAFGVIGQYLILSRTKQVLDQNRTDITRVRKDTYNMSPFAAKAHVNIGYRGFTLFGEYSLTPLFQQGKGPELYPFTAGVRIVPFT